MSEEEGPSSSSLAEVDDLHIGEDGESFAYDALNEIEAIYEEFVEAMDDIEERESSEGTVTPLTPQERSLLLEFYTVLHAHMERLCANILYETLADKETRKPEPTLGFFREKLSQEQREGLLFRTGVIDSGMKGELTKIRRARNQLVHEQHKRMYIDSDNKTRSDVDRAFDAVSELDDLLNEIASISPSSN